MSASISHLPSPTSGCMRPPAGTEAEWIAAHDEAVLTRRATLLAELVCGLDSLQRAAAELDALRSPGHFFDREVAEGRDRARHRRPHRRQHPQSQSGLRRRPPGVRQRAAVNARRHPGVVRAVRPALYCAGLLAISGGVVVAVLHAVVPSDEFVPRLPAESAIVRGPGPRSDRDCIAGSWPELAEAQVAGVPPGGSPICQAWSTP